MATIHMLVGIPASGKSTYAKELARNLNIPIVSSDEMRNLHPDVQEKDIWPLIYNECIRLVENGQDFIYDATNITPKVRTNFKNIIKEHTNDFVIGTYFFDTDPKICYDRAIKRNEMPGERYIPPEVILSYGDKVIAPQDDEGFIFRKVIKNDSNN
ncbi:MAG: AAA family ATPase [Bacilli bacterium]|nr:AAA family ATPase [Bacilli bacterium]